MPIIKAKLIIFDFDGTLVDSKRDIAFAVNGTLKRMDIPEMTYEDIYSYVGNGVRPLIVEKLEAAGKMADLDRAIEHFRELYIAHLLDTTVLFDGVEELLTHFKPDKKMAVASNKPYRYVEKIIEGLGMAHFFVSVKGGDSVTNKKPHPDMLVAIMDETFCKKENTLFVGDSGIDIQTGKNAGVKTVGATYGFRPREEVLGSLPDALIERPLQLKEIIQ